MTEMLDLEKETKNVGKRKRVDKELDLKPVESGQDGRTMAFITRVLGWDRWMEKKRKRGARKVTSCRHRNSPSADDPWQRHGACGFSHADSH